MLWLFQVHRARKWWWWGSILHIRLGIQVLNYDPALYVYHSIAMYVAWWMIMWVTLESWQVFWLITGTLPGSPFVIFPFFCKPGSSLVLELFLPSDLESCTDFKCMKLDPCWYIPSCVWVFRCRSGAAAGPCQGIVSFNCLLKFPCKSRRKSVCVLFVFQTL